MADGFWWFRQAIRNWRTPGRSSLFWFCLNAGQKFSYGFSPWELLWIFERDNYLQHYRGKPFIQTFLEWWQTCKVRYRDNRQKWHKQTIY